MRSLIIIVLDLMLLVSVAASLGNDNSENVMSNVETTGTSIIGADLAQIDNINANLMGSNIHANQFVRLTIDDSNLVGQSNGETNDIQMADMMLNDTGCGNIDLQFVAINQDENCLTIGNITQLTALKADDIGYENSIDQSSSSSIGNFFGFIEPNVLTNSDLKQTSILDACVAGNANNAVQGTNQFITDNILTNSKLYEQAETNADILGCENNLGLGSQGIFQTADSNLLTSSSASQLIYLDEQSSGCLNDISQLARPYLLDNALTSSTMLQSINVDAETLGSSNIFDQNVDLRNEGNSAVGGQLVQITDIESNS